MNNLIKYNFKNNKNLIIKIIILQLVLVLLGFLTHRLIKPSGLRELSFMGAFAVYLAINI